MSFTRWLRTLQSAWPLGTTAGTGRRKARSRPAPRCRPCLESLEDRFLLSAGQLDPTFGVGGKVVSDFFGPTNASAGPTAVQGDGKVIVAGTSTDVSTMPAKLALARYNTDGSLDAGFGQKGEVLTDLGGSFSVAAVVVQPTGQVVVAGTWGSEFLLVRYTAGGVLDAGFGSGGKVLTDLGFAPSAAAVQADGKIVVVGNTGNDFAVVRYNANGTLDTGFGGGMVTTDFGGDDGARSVAIQSDQKIVVGGVGNFNPYYDTGSAALARYNPDGSLDAGFGSGGKTMPIGLPVDCLAIQTDGKILLGGSAREGNFGPYAYHIIRVDAAGHLDTGFGYNGGQGVGNDLDGFGLVLRNIGLTSDGKIEAIAFDDDMRDSNLCVTRYLPNGTVDPTFGGPGFFVGEVLVKVPAGDVLESWIGGAVTAGDKVLVVATASGPHSQDFSVFRLTAAGAPDPTFGNAGSVLTEFLGSANDYATAVALQSDGKVVVAGVIGGLGGVARYNADGSLDTSFGSGGQAASAGFTVNDVALQSDGKIVVIGTIPDPNSFLDTFAVARYNPDGTLDPSFGSKGEVAVPLPLELSGSAARSVTIQADGKIVIAGGNQYDEAGITLVRLNGDGSLDTNFDGDGIAVTHQVNSSSFGAGIDVAVRPDGRIDVLTDVAVLQYRPDGSVDPAFGQNGLAPVVFGGSNYDLASSLALQADGKIVIVGAKVDGDVWTSQYSVGLTRLNADGTLDTSFGRGTGKVVTDLGDNEAAGKVAVASDGRIVVLGAGGSVVRYLPGGDLDGTFGNGGVATATVGISVYGVPDLALQPNGQVLVVGSTQRDATGIDLALARLLAYDSVVQASSATLAADLQAAVTALHTTPAAVTPRVVIHVQDPARMPTVAAAIAHLTGNPAGPVIELFLDMEPGSYSLGQISVPAGLRLIVDGTSGLACNNLAFVGAAAPALTLLSGDVVIRNGAVFTATGNVPTILVQGGHLTVRNSTIDETTDGNQPAFSITGGLVDLGTADDLGGNTINVHGKGLLIRNTGPNDVSAIGNTFLQDGTAFADDYRIEDAIDHSMDGLGGGTVFWVPGNVFVSANRGSVQRGVDLVPVGGTVNVESGVHGDFAAGAKLLTVAFQDGSSMTQQMDDLDPTRRSVVVMGTYGNDTIHFEPGPDKGIRVNMNHVPSGSFLPTGRLIAIGQDGSDDIEVSDGITLSAWLYGGISGNNHLQGGGGNDVLIGGYGNDTLSGGGGRDLLIAAGGSDHLDGKSGDDILIGGVTQYDDAAYNPDSEAALAALMAEWTSGQAYATRVNDVVNGGGLNGAYILNGSVYYDGGMDVLDGGPGQDLFFAALADKVKGQRLGETVVSL